MPELPEVEVTRQGIAPKITGACIIAVRQGLPLRWALGCKSEVLLKQKIHHVRRRGKYIILDLDCGVLLIHLGMSGRLIFEAALPPPCKHDHFDLLTTQGALRLHDPRRFGAVVWSNAENEGMALKLLGHLGMEPLDATFDQDHFLNELKKHTASIKQVLLSGQVVVGIGNIYACEVLFAAKIDPRKAACKISKQKALNLAKEIQRILNLAIKQGGTTLKDFRTPEGDHGLFQEQTKVYGHKNQPCVACGTPIQSILLGQRSTFFCKHCQK